MATLMRLWHILSLSSGLPHEATHWAVAWLVTDDAQMAAEVTGGRAITVWSPLDNCVLRFLVHLAPTILGSFLAVIWLVSGISVDGWRFTFAIGLAAYTIPSPPDVRGALGKDVQQS